MGAEPFPSASDGLRRPPTVNGTATDFVLDGSSVVRELRAGTAHATYLHGPRGPECRRDDVYGAVRAHTGSGTSAHRFVGGLGHASEGETGHIYMRARYLDPTTGRFVSEDPRESGSNWYIYCSQNPVNLVDPTGEEEEKPWQDLDIIMGVFGVIGGLISSVIFRVTAMAVIAFMLLPELLLAGIVMGQHGCNLAAAAIYIAVEWTYNSHLKPNNVA